MPEDVFVNRILGKLLSHFLVYGTWYKGVTSTFGGGSITHFYEWKLRLRLKSVLFARRPSHFFLLPTVFVFFIFSFHFTPN